MLTCRKYVTHLLLCLLLAGCLHDPGTASEQKMDTATVLRHVDECGRQITSGRVVIWTESTDLEQPIRREVRQTEAWFDGVRVRRENRVYRPDSPPNGLPRRFTEYWMLWDGARFTSVAPPRFHLARVSEHEQWRIRGSGYQAVDHALGRGGLADHVSGWHGQLVGEEMVGDLRCLRLDTPPTQAPKTATVIQRYWFAPDRGYVLVKEESDIAWPRDAGVRRKRTVWRVDEWTQLEEGLWLPDVITKSVYIGEPDKEEELRYTERSEVVSAAVNIPLPDSIFQFDLTDATVTVPIPSAR